MFDWLKTKEVRKRIVFTLFILCIFQIGTFIPLPYIVTLKQSSVQDGFSQLLNLSSGGSLHRFGLFMLGVSPYITSNILMSILQKTVPFLCAKTKTQSGRSSLGQYTRILTCIFAMAQGYGILFNPIIQTQFNIQVSSVYSERILILCLIACGSLFVSYLGEKIDESGIGQGASVLIGVGILTSLPSQLKAIVDLYPVFHRTGQLNVYYKQVGFISILFLGILLSSYFINKIEFKYPIQSMVNPYKVEAHYLPIKLLASSVMPVIFSSAFLTLCSAVSQTYQLNWEWTQHQTSSPVGMVIYVVLIFFFSFIYNFMYIDSSEIQTQFQESGLYIIGHRQSEISTFIQRQLFKITLIGAPILTLIATSSMIGEYVLGQGFPLHLTGVSLLIMTGVFYEVVHQIKGLTQKHNYKEILKI